MTRGFLLIDASKNTMIIPWNDGELTEIIKRKGLRKVHKHKTLKELDTDVHNYINGKYVEEDNEY